MFRESIRKVIPAVTMAALISAGCASSKLVNVPTEAPADLGFKASNQEMETQVHYIIQPDGPGSWVKGAKWIEFKVSLRTLRNRIYHSKSSILLITAEFIWDQTTLR